jgi:hypothetical protein
MGSVRIGDHLTARVTMSASAYLQQATATFYSTEPTSGIGSDSRSQPFSAAKII